MAASTEARRAAGLIRAALLAAGLLAAQTPVTLRQAAERRPDDFTPLRAGQPVAVKGVVSHRAIAFRTYTHLPIAEGGVGLMLEGPLGAFAELRPGQILEAAGKIGHRAGLPVLWPDSVRVVGAADPPLPLRLEPGELQSFLYLALPATTEGAVVEAGATTGGPYLLIGSERKPYKIFLPFSPGGVIRAFEGIAVGDQVRVTGISSQYSGAPPYDGFFELVVDAPEDVVVTGRRWPLPPALLGGAVLAALLVSVLWWRRDVRLRAQREMLRRAYDLGEEILHATSAADLHRKLSDSLPRIFAITRTRLFAYDRGTETLEELGEEPGRSISLADPGEGLEAAAAACFQNRTLLAIPDTARSPFPPPAGVPAPRSALLLPLLADDQPAGVLQLDQDDRERELSADERVLAQHLANQVALVLQLQGQRLVREQLFRTEKLAAVGRLISGVVDELQAPLSSIAQLAQQAQGKPEPTGELEAIAAQARAAGGIVSRLVSFVGAQTEAVPVPVSALLRGVAETRAGEWSGRGIRFEDLTNGEGVYVLGSRAQLEEVLRSLLQEAETATASGDDKRLSLRSHVVAGRVLIDIGYRAPPGRCAEPPDFAVCRSLIAGHGGELRALELAGGHRRFEINLPGLPAERVTATPRPRNGLHRGTALLIEPDENTQRQAVAVLSARGYRVVPVNSGDAGLDLAQRVRFELVLCSARAPGLNWVELSERLQPRGGAFILLAEGYDPEVGGEGAFVVSKPLDATRFLIVLDAAERYLETQSKAVPS